MPQVEGSSPSQGFFLFIFLIIFPFSIYFFLLCSFLLQSFNCFSFSFLSSFSFFPHLTLLFLIHSLFFRHFSYSAPLHSSLFLFISFLPLQQKFQPVAVTHYSLYPNVTSFTLCITSLHHFYKLLLVEVPPPPPIFQSKLIRTTIRKMGRGDR